RKTPPLAVPPKHAFDGLLSGALISKANAEQSSGVAAESATMMIPRVGHRSRGRIFGCWRTALSRGVCVRDGLLICMLGCLFWQRLAVNSDYAGSNHRELNLSCNLRLNVLL